MLLKRLGVLLRALLFRMAALTYLCSMGLLCFWYSVQYGLSTPTSFLTLPEERRKRTRRPRITDSARRHRAQRSPLPGRPAAWWHTIPLPASITSVVDAPRLVNSEASPTRPECAVTRLSTPAANAAAVNRSPIICDDNDTTRSVRPRTPGSAQGPEGARDAVLHEPHVVHLALLILRRIHASRLASTRGASQKPK